MTTLRQNNVFVFHIACQKILEEKLPSLLNILKVQEHYRTWLELVIFLEMTSKIKSMTQVSLFYKERIDT